MSTYYPGVHLKELRKPM